MTLGADVEVEAEVLRVAAKGVRHITNTTDDRALRDAATKRLKPSWPPPVYEPVKTQLQRSILLEELAKLILDGAGIMDGGTGKYQRLLDCMVRMGDLAIQAERSARK
jgi:hypothetical protein